MKSAEQSKDDDDRTNSMGLFNQAEAYRLSAMALEERKIKSGFADHPIWFCYCHALELYLKALLRQKYSVAEIEAFRHNIKRLVNEAEKLELVLADKERVLLFIIGDADTLIEVRYVRTGPKTLPELEELNRTCKNIRDSVASLLRKAGVMVRLS